MDDTLKKAEEILNETIKAFREGNYELGDKLKTIFNNLLENKKEIEKERVFSIYGKNKNFGIIHYIMEQNSPGLYKTKNGRKIIAKYIKLIRENSDLKKQFDAYNAICEKKSIKNIKDYINEYFNKIECINKSSVKKSNDLLIRFINENKINENINISEGLKELFESIEYVLTNKPTLLNINEIQDAKGKIEDFLCENNKEKTIKKETDINNAIDEFISSLDEKYMKENISNDDKKYFSEMFQAVINNDTSKKRNILFEYKDDLFKKLDNIDEIENNEIKYKIEEIKNKIYDTIKNTTDEVYCLSKLSQINETIKDIK